jgi:hypothetical protein
MKVNNKFTEEFKVQYGVRQGDPLSATLFSMVIDVILKPKSRLETMLRHP